MKTSIAVYLLIGLALSLKAAPISWKTIFQGQPGNVPFWVGLWPWPVAAQAYKYITGEFPDWTPEV